MSEQSKKKLAKAVGYRIKAARLKANIAQQHLAALCDFEKSNMSRIESGKTNLTVHNLYKITSALGISISSLLEGIEDAIDLP